MTFESAVQYTEESLRHSKEILLFLKKKQIASNEYAKGLSKVGQNTMKSASSINSPEIKFNENSHLRRVFQELNEGISSIMEVHVILISFFGLSDRKLWQVK